MGLDYKKKYLKYKNKYLEAKKIYGGGDPGATDPNPLEKFTDEYWQDLDKIIANVDTKMQDVANIKGLNVDINSLNKIAKELKALKNFVKEKSELAGKLGECDQEKALLIEKVKELEAAKTQLQQDLTTALSQTNLPLALVAQSPADKKGIDAMNEGDNKKQALGVFTKIDGLNGDEKKKVLEAFDKIIQLEDNSKYQMVMAAFDNIIMIQDAFKKKTDLEAFDKELDGIAGMPDGDNKEQALAELAESVAVAGSK